jgi:Rieske Fe-S protein
MTQGFQSSSGETRVWTRRGVFLRWLSYLFGAVAAAAVAVPFLGYVFGALRRTKEIWYALGPVEKFPVNETRFETFVNPLHQPWDGMTAKIGAYVRNLGDGRFLIFAMNCTHLGCPVSWFPQSGLFMCPCHGGVFYENGDRAAGPPPRGLYRYVWRVRDGQLEVQAPHLPTLQNTLRTDESV